MLNKLDRSLLIPDGQHDNPQPNTPAPVGVSEAQAKIAQVKLTAVLTEAGFPMQVDVAPCGIDSKAGQFGLRLPSFFTLLDNGMTLQQIGQMLDITNTFSRKHQIPVTYEDKKFDIISMLKRPLFFDPFKKPNDIAAEIKNRVDIECLKNVYETLDRSRRNADSGQEVDYTAAINLALFVMDIRDQLATDSGKQIIPLEKFDHKLLITKNITGLWSDMIDILQAGLRQTTAQRRRVDAACSVIEGTLLAVKLNDSDMTIAAQCLTSVRSILSGQAPQSS